MSIIILTFQQATLFYIPRCNIFTYHASTYLHTIRQHSKYFSGTFCPYHTAKKLHTTPQHFYIPTDKVCTYLPAGYACCNQPVHALLASSPRMRFPLRWTNTWTVGPSGRSAWSWFLDGRAISGSTFRFARAIACWSPGEVKILIYSL